jgi:hypothetical protein
MKWTAAAYTPSGFFRHERAVENRRAANASRSLQGRFLMNRPWMRQVKI